MTIDTKNSPRRTLKFTSFEEIIAEVDRIQQAVEAGSASHTGNWAIGEICDHCAKFIRFACDGFDGLAPAPIRLIFRLMYFKKAFSDEPIPAGFKLPKKASALLPTPGITDTEGLGELRKQLKRVIAGKDMTAPSPLFGKLTHEQWLIIQRKHCALHLGFINPGETLDDA